MGTFRPILQILVCMHVLWWGVQGMATESPEVCDPRLIATSHFSEERLDCQGPWGSFCESLWTIKEASVQKLGLTLTSEENSAGIHYVFNGWPSESFCLDNWNINVARISCISFGFQDAVYIASAKGGPAIPPTTIVNTISCTGDERNFNDCPQIESAYQSDLCIHNARLTVVCQVGKKSLNIVDQIPGYPERGRVAVTVNNQLRGTICNSTWDQAAANVVCRDLGFKRGALRFFTIGGEATGDIFDSVNCTGDEKSFSDCRSELVQESRSDCDHTQDAGVECFANDNSLIEFKSVAGSYEGVVYYRVESRIALICDQTWTNKEAAVACRMEGYEGGTATNVVDLAQKDSTDIFQWDIVCNGDEERLEDCIVTKRDNPTSCAPANIAQVRCGPNKANDDTLIDFLSGASSNEGVVYYRAEGRRALICDQTWTNKEAAVACRMQGYRSGTATKIVDLAPKDYTDIFQWNIVCNGKEERLEDCTVTKGDTSTSCAPENIAQVRCGPNKDLDLRMTGSELSEQGRLETYKDGDWVNVWLISFGGFYNPIYHKLCKAMGYDRALYVYTGAKQMPFQEGSQDAGVLCHLQSLDNSLRYHYLTGTTGSGSSYDTGIVCKPFDIVAYHPIRLVDIYTNDINNQSGLVEIYHDGQWGNICKNSSYSELVCSDLGYKDTTFATSLDTQTVGGGGTRTWFSRSTVYGTCNTVFGCQHTAWGDLRSECDPMAVRCVPGRASSLESLALSLIIMVVVVTVDLGFIDV